MALLVGVDEDLGDPLGVVGEGVVVRPLHQGHVAGLEADRGGVVVPQPGVSSRGEPGEAQVPATIDTEAQDALPRSEYRAVPMPAPTTDVPPDAGDEWLRAFQQEERDEPWAAPLETEIRKSLEPEINLGRFYLANAECRATLCEIRLLARGSLQRAELDLFQSTIYTLPWNAHLNPALSSGTDSGDGYESIWIFERRPESASGVR